MPRRAGEGWGYTSERAGEIVRFDRSVVESVFGGMDEARRYHAEVERIGRLFAQMPRRAPPSPRARHARERDTTRAHATAQHGQPPRKTHRRPARAG